MQKVREFLLLVLVILFGFYFTSHAQLSSPEIKILSEKADVILTGKVVQQNSSWNEDKTRIYTRATIEVQDYIKGNKNGNSIVVSYLGGEVGDIGESYSHVATFENNEEVLVFLKKNELNEDYNVLYGEEGKINLVNDPRTGELVTSSNIRVSSLKTQIKNLLND